MSDIIPYNDPIFNLIRFKVANTDAFIKICQDKRHTSEELDIIQVIIRAYDCLDDYILNSLKSRISLNGATANMPACRAGDDGSIPS